MYSNYIAEVGKLVYLIGEIQTTSNFKKMLDPNDRKSKYFFKCVDELPGNAYQKVKVDCRRKGILRCDWFNKILDKSPMMIFMIFNFCEPLEKNEKWQDRLSIALRKINKVAEVLRYSNKQEIPLRIIVIISKDTILQSQMTGNLIEKITNFLKNYEKQLSIFQVDHLNKEINKNKPHWFSILDKTYERKYRTIVKRKEQTLGERRFGCLIKIAVISEILGSKKQSYGQYEEAYKSLHYKFVEMNKNRVEFLNFDAIRQIRTLADIVLIRMILVRMSLKQDSRFIPQAVSNHVRYFFQRNTNHLFYKVENLLWRQNFLHNFEEVVYTHDYFQGLPKNFMAQIINSFVSICLELTKSHTEITNFFKQQEVKGRMVPKEQNLYIGSYNYTKGIEVTDVDIIWTELKELQEKQKDFITMGMQTITRYKSMKIFRKNQVNFLNISLLRYYLLDHKFESIGNVFSQIINSRIHDLYLLNNLIKQLESEANQTTDQKLLFYGVSTLIADYFNSLTHLEQYGKSFVSLLGTKKSQQSMDLLSDVTTQAQGIDEGDAVVLPIPVKSSICEVEVLIQNNMHPIQQCLQLSITLRTNNKFLLDSNLQRSLIINFNHPQIKRQIKIPGSHNIDNIKVKIDPLQYFSKDQTLSIDSTILKISANPTIHFFIQKVKYSRYQTIGFFTKLQVPQIHINIPYETYYINETCKFTIQLGQISDSSVNLQANFTAKQEQGEALTEIYTDPLQKLNIINSKCYNVLQKCKKNVFYFKCNKLGNKAIKFIFHLNISQNIGGKELKNTHTITRDIGFNVINLFKTIKIMKQSFTGAQLKFNQIPTNKKIMLIYSLRPAETVCISEIGQNQNEKSLIKTWKQISPVQDLLLTPDQKLRNVYIFEVQQKMLKEKETNGIFLVSFYIKWSRIDLDLKLGLSSDEEIKNIYLQKQIKIGLKPDQVQIHYEEGKILKKKTKETLGVKYRNLTPQNIYVQSIMENSQAILRVGEKGKTTVLGPHQTKTIIFDILPTKIGYHPFPQVQSYFDGHLARQKQCSSILCVL